MKVLSFIVLAGVFLTASLSSCNEETITVDTSLPQGTFSVDRSGTFVDQNAAGSTGTASLGTDEEGTQFLKLSSDFMTAVGTGTVTVYFSTSMDYVASPETGNPDLRLIGFVQENGEHYFKVDPVLESGFTHVILWCGSASVPFGYAALN